MGLIASRLLGIGWSVTLHGLSDFESPEVTRLGDKIAKAAFVRCVSDYGASQAKQLECPSALAKNSRCSLRSRLGSVS